eukprot:1814526-Prymnesium_polylepis.2
MAQRMTRMPRVHRSSWRRTRTRATYGIGKGWSRRARRPGAMTARASNSRRRTHGDSSTCGDRRNRRRRGVNKGSGIRSALTWTRALRCQGGKRGRKNGGRGGGRALRVGARQSASHTRTDGPTGRVFGKHGGRARGRVCEAITGAHLRAVGGGGS